jgi:hypothetical protein
LLVKQREEGEIFIGGVGHKITTFCQCADATRIFTSVTSYICLSRANSIKSHNCIKVACCIVL